MPIEEIDAGDRVLSNRDAARGLVGAVRRWRAVAVGLLVACGPAVAAPGPDEAVEVYWARTGTWVDGVRAEVEVGDTYLDDGHLYRLTADGAEDRGPATLAALGEADRVWVPDAPRWVPASDEWVLVLGDGDDAGHWRLGDVAPGSLFAFGGEVYETRAGPEGLEIRTTGDVVGEASATFIRAVPKVIDAVVVHADGSKAKLTGTANHPFWVPGERRYVALGALEVGTPLHVLRGGGALLVGKTWRQGDFEVFDFEVAGLHNFYVRGEGSDAAVVLVHNSALPPGTMSLDEVAETSSIARRLDTTIDVVGSRAAGKGRGVGTDLPVGKDPPGAPGTTRSDIDFRVDDAHPQHDALCKECGSVGNGAGNASIDHSNNPMSLGRETYPPYIRFGPDGSVTHVTE